MSCPAPAATGPARTVNTGWPMQRILFVLAGTATLLGVLLTASVSRWFLIIPALVGANQLLMVAVGWCPMSLLLTRLGLGQPAPTRTAAR